MRVLAATVLLLPGAAFACALPPSVVMTLPTGYYMAGAAATVALTALLGSASSLPEMRGRLVWRRRVLLPIDVTSYAAFLCFLALLLVGFFGSRDPMHNLMTLVFWTVIWVALPLASMLLGNLWRPLNPWTAPVRIARTLLGWQGTVGLRRLGHLPAVAGYLGFGWFQIVSLSPDDPAVLAGVALAYWLVIFALAVVEGEDWLEQGEFLTVYFGLVAKVAPFWLEIRGHRADLKAGFPGSQVLAMPPLSRSATAFVTLALAVLTFDGLRETFWWMGLIGVNPLEFPGRSAVMGINTLGLLATWGLTSATILGALALGRRLGGMSHGPVMLSFLAIAAGYHGAHYLVTLLTSGQFTLAALNDPFFRGDALLGLSAFYVSFGFMSDASSMTLIWNAQFAAILGAHLLAVILGLRLAGSVQRVAHLPVTVLMVGYTVLGLWLLSSPTGA